MKTIFLLLAAACLVASEKCLPLFEDGTFGFAVQYKSTTKTWELLLPERDVFGKPDALLREADENFIALGEMDSNDVITKVTLVHPKYSYFNLERYTLEEIEEAVEKGYVEIFKHGKRRKVFVRDPAITYALFQAAMRSLLP